MLLGAKDEVSGAVGGTAGYGTFSLRLSNFWVATIVKVDFEAIGISVGAAVIAEVTAA